MRTHLVLKAAAVAAILMAGSCAAPVQDINTATMEDGAANHPITVAPSYREMKLQYAPAYSGMLPADAPRFTAFVADYRAHGNGSISLSVPAGPPAGAAISYFAEAIAATGVPRDHILVSTHQAQGGDFRVDLNYVVYEAHADSCGDWSENLAYTADNLTPKNFGCSVQRNIAAMVADPRDLLGPRAMDPRDGKRDAVIMDNYEQGKPTAAEKTADQSGAVSDVSR
jgi:pilus assembly protein CpaD